MSTPQEFPTLRFVNVTRPAPGALTVRWVLNPHAWALADLAFQIYRSNSPTGNWDLLCTVEQGVFAWTDFDVFAPGVARQYYYLVRCVSLTQRGVYRDSDATGLEMELDGIAAELIRKKWTFLTVRGGNHTAILVRKTWGVTCSRCYNHARQVATDPSCLDCYGTGYSGGYLKPMYVPALMNLPQAAVVAAQVPYLPGTIYAEVANVPRVSPDDVLVNTRLNMRFRVQQVTPATHRMTVVSQVMSLIRADENDVVYTLPVKAAPAAGANRAWDLVDRTSTEPSILKTSRINTEETA